MLSSSRFLLGISVVASTLGLVVLDQWTKALAAANLAGKDAVHLLGGFVVVVYTSNRGAFLSLGSGLPPLLRTIILIILPIGALALFAWVFVRRDATKAFGSAAGKGGYARATEAAVAALVFSGGIGNLIDRILYVRVRDFVYFMFWKIPTGIMNLADLYILAALIVAVVAAAIRSPRARRPRDKSEPDSTDI